MSSIKQAFIADLTAKSIKDILEAYENIPADKRSWSPLEKGRSADDQLAECAMLAGKTADTIKSKSFANIDFAQFFKDKEELATQTHLLTPLLTENGVRIVDTIRAVSDNDLTYKVDAPWGPMTIEEIIVYPYWNFTYHLGQINYIASLLGCLS